ncbi:MAG: HAD family hydrolase [Aestuariivita sp.]|nr:HAD family hydrolase [Aestuariivita sp.]MCY4204018.1 HAD family hydrolase [Aestuariivita sp.]MCY4289751.1 HAD family hydrolase [Aestuariivita sp.]MCY4347629.1 HAD family hydrolase [Aestuariivita sp.]
MHRAIIFDKDGTLFDFHATWTGWAKALLLRLAGDNQTRAAEMGKAIGFDFVGRYFRSDSIAIAGTTADIARRLLPFLVDETLDSLLATINSDAREAAQAEVVPLAPFLDLLLRRGLKLGVVTNDSEQSARVHLQRAGVLDRFAYIAGYDSGLGIKPDEGPLLSCCAALGVSARETIMVGDSWFDLEPARRTGMMAVGVLTGMAEAAELKRYADVVLTHIGDIPTWLDKETVTLN